MSGSLVIPNRIGSQPGGTGVGIAAQKFDQDYETIRDYVNDRQVSFGPIASRPAPSLDGRYWYATDTGELSVDTGTLWLSVGFSGGIASSGLVPGASGSVNRAAFQAAIDGLPASGGAIQITTYGNHIDGEITVTKPFTLLGPGTTEVSTPGPFVLILDTPSQIGFNVTAKGPFVMQNMSILGAADTTAIFIDGPTGALKGTESVRVDNVVFLDGAYGIDFRGAWGQMVTRCVFWNHTVAGIRVRNVLDGDQGDSLIAHNVFQTSTVTAFGVVYNSGGGLKIALNKFLGGKAGIAVDPTTTLTDPLTISDLIIANNSVEGFNDFGIFLTRTAGALVPIQIHIIGNQIAPAAGAGLVGIDISPAGAADAYIAVIIADNIITNTTTAAIRLRKVNGVNIHGNFIAVPAGTVFDVDATAVSVTIGPNKFFDFTTLITGTASGVLLQGGKLTVAQLPASVAPGSQVFVGDALGPGDGGYTGYGMTATGGGNGAPAFMQLAGGVTPTWKV